MTEQLTKTERELTAAEEEIYKHYVQYCRRIGARPASASEYFRVTGKF